ncbi:4-coumarate--CoA ligase [Massilia glaciei]|uniref:4-coumarate--CoA ligase n=2 Tax=Massilia glaciei TaxID=1524097 RepID=A0A2U2I5W0_9BURK|nr:4-coumarate--CoA ligase [Massilia glaciei]
MRHDSALSNAHWGDALSLDDDLGVDSLELMQLAGTLAQALHLHLSGVEDYLLARRTLGQWVDVAAAGLAHDARRITFHTSGSGGAPKPCGHALGALEQEAAELARLFGGRRRLVVAVPCHHLYGFLFSILLARALGLGVDAVVDARGWVPAQLARRLLPGDLVLGHPAFWRGVADGAQRMPADVVGVSSTAPCPPALAHALAGCGLAALIEVYGSSETAGVGWRAGPDAPFRLFKHWSRDPALPATLSRTLPDGGTLACDCPDLLDWRDGRHFVLGARHDSAVQVGGVNVFPERVREVLRRHPQVRDAAVRLMRADEGDRLKAFIVPAPGVDDPALFAAQLRRWIDRMLPAAQRPKAIATGSALPRTAAGKLCDWNAGN